MALFGSVEGQLQRLVNPQLLKELIRIAREVQSLVKDFPER